WRATLVRSLRTRTDARRLLAEAELRAGELVARAVVEAGGVRFGVGTVERFVAVARPAQVEETLFRWLAATGLRAGREETVALVDLEHARVRDVRLRVGTGRAWHGRGGTEIEVTEPCGIGWRCLADERGAMLESAIAVPGS